MAKKFVVDVFRTIAQSIVVEANTEEEAEEKASSMVENGNIQWKLTDHLTDDYEVEVSGEEDENGERHYK